MMIFLEAAIWWLMGSFTLVYFFLFYGKKEDEIPVIYAVSSEVSIFGV